MDARTGDAWFGLKEERRDNGLRGVTGDSPFRKDDVEARFPRAGEADLLLRLIVLELRRRGLGGGICAPGDEPKR